MSAFLGSIHHWLYGKIEFQNGLVERLSDMISKTGMMMAFFPKWNKSMGRWRKAVLKI